MNNTIETYSMNMNKNKTLAVHAKVSEEEKDHINGLWMAYRITTSSFIAGRMSEEEMYSSFLKYSEELSILCDKYNIDHSYAELKFESCILTGTRKEIQESVEEDLSEVRRNFYMYNAYINAIKQLKTGEEIEKKFEHLLSSYKNYVEKYNNNILDISNKYENFNYIDVLLNKIFLKNRKDK